MNNKYMNIQNLTQEEIKSLHEMLGKMLEEPNKKLSLDPVNDLVDDILESFDFNKVRKVMWHLDWKWSSASDEIPTIEELKREAKRLLVGAADYRLTDLIHVHHQSPISYATGGLEAMAWCNEEKTKITDLKLQFVLADWDSSITELNNK
jgi:hypothetical protein